MANQVTQDPNASAAQKTALLKVAEPLVQGIEIQVGPPSTDNIDYGALSFSEAATSTRKPSLDFRQASNSQYVAVLAGV
jgi:hypothetical protein